MGAPRLTLYVAGETLRSSPAVEGLRRAAHDRLDPMAELEVVDVVEHPERAQADGVKLVPTLILGDPLSGPRAFGEILNQFEALIPALLADA